MSEEKPPIPAENYKHEEALKADALTDYLDSLLSEATESEADRSKESTLGSIEEKELSVVTEPLVGSVSDIKATNRVAAKTLAEVTYNSDLSIDKTSNTSNTSKTSTSMCDVPLYQSDTVEQGGGNLAVGRVAEGVRADSQNKSRGGNLSSKSKRVNNSECTNNKVEAVSQREFISTVVRSEELQQSIADNWRAENGRPYWAQSRFDCLLFDIGNIRLAAPLVTLGSILKVEQTFTPLAGQPDWFLGLMRSNKLNIQIVDTVKWLMPEKVDASFQESIEFVITLVDLEWGLACTGVHNAESVDPENVKWRTNHMMRPWFAGTVIDQMCSILDIETLQMILNKSDFCQ